MHLYYNEKLVMQGRYEVIAGVNSLRGREELGHNECKLTLKSIMCQFREVILIEVNYAL